MYVWGYEGVYTYWVLCRKNDVAMLEYKCVPSSLQYSFYNYRQLQRGSLSNTQVRGPNHNTEV